MKKIVIVEDEILVKKGLVLTTDWEKLGCRVVGEAENGLQGIEVIEKLKPDIVLTDVRMPGMNGIEMIERLKGKVEAEYIILSAYSEFSYAKKAISLGVREYLVKPIDDDELETAVLRATEHLLERKRYLALQEHIENSEISKALLFKEYYSDGKNSRTDNMNKAVSYIVENYSKDISIKDVCESIGISESYLARLFKQESGYTFNDYLTNYRIKQACFLLADPQIRVYEVAEKVGYKSQRYFGVVFKKLVGKTPGDFKETGI